MPVASIGCEVDLTYSHKNLGDDISALKEIIDERSEFAEILKNAKNPLLILGHDMVARPDGELLLSYAKKIAEKFHMVREGWNGFNFLAKSTGLLNGLITGFVGDSNVEEILTKAEKNEIKLVILHGVDDEIDFEKLKNCFVIYIGTHGDRGAHIADVILPAAAYSEKNALYFNLEGRAQTTSRAVFAPGEAKEDLKIIAELAQELGLGALEPHAPEKNLQTSWIKSAELKSDFSDKKIAIRNFDFYLTNPVARASRTLNRCSAELS